MRDYAKKNYHKQPSWASIVAFLLLLVCSVFWIAHLSLEALAQ